MQSTTKTVVCRKPGLSQEAALADLYAAYGNVRVASIKRRGDQWVAQIRQAEFPPSKGDKPEGGGGPPAFGGGEDEEAPAPDGPPDAEGGDDLGGDPTDGPPGLDGEGGDEGKDEKGGEMHQMMHLLHEIAQALGVGGGMDGGMAPGDEAGGPPMPGPEMGGDMGGPPEMGGPPGGAPPLKKPLKLKPGEVLPTQTPVGAPAFSSVRQSATMTVQSARVDPRQMTPVQAEADLNRQFNLPHGYRVKQLRFDRESSTYQALLSIH